jgi:hypothetical protein
MTERQPDRRQPDLLSARSRSQPRGRGGPDPLEQGLDRLVSAGRQLVDGVAGTRPGSRAGGRGGERPRLAGLGRWVEEKLDWILEEEDDWREPWQLQQRGSSRAASQPPAASPRRPLEAISRRRGASAAAADVAWPDDDSFSLSRWQRPSQAAGPREPAPPAPAARPLPRSSRRRQP